MDRKTTPSPWARRVLVGAFVVVVCGVGIVQAGLAVVRGEAPQFLDLFRQIPTQANLRSYEAELEDASWIQQEVRPAMHRLGYRLLGALGKDVVIGRQGWLFYTPSIEYLVEPWPPRKTPAGFSLASKDETLPTESIDALSSIVSFRDQLKARGIRLLVVPVPGKPSIYPDKVAARAEDIRAGMGRHTRALIDDLRAHDVDVVDLFDVLEGAREAGNSEALYLERDTHWAPKGMRLAAEAVAAQLVDNGMVQPGDVDYDVSEKTVKREGDIVRMIRVPAIEASIPTQTVTCEQVVQPGERVYEDSPEAKVLVLGDSFLRIYQTDAPEGAGFIAHLARALRQPVTSVVNDGGATTLVRQVVARQPKWFEGKSVVVWEFVERDIRFGERGWEELKLR